MASKQKVKQMTSFDIRACVSELQILVGGKVEKVYHHPPDEIRIRIYAGEKYDLVIEAGRRIHLTKFPRESPRFPSSFAMLLRKHLEGARIEKIEQHDFDRIVVITFRRGEEEKKLVAELFLKGNIILLENSRVIMPLKSGVKAGENYSFPEPIRIGEVTDESRDAVRALALSGLGGLYAEEVCFRSSIDKKKKFSELSEEDRNRIAKAIEELVNFVPKPQIIVKEGEYVDVVPMDLLYYSNYEKKYFESFNEALDDFYSRKIVESAEIERVKSIELEKLKNRLRIQQETKKKLEAQIDEFRRKADLLYENYLVVEKIIQTLNSAREKMEWKKIEKAIEKEKAKNELAAKIKRIIPEKNSVIVDLDGTEVEVDITRSVHENANIYYEKAKRTKEKLPGIEEAIKNTIEEMQKTEELLEKKYVSSIKVRRKRKWYENFRWFITSDGFLAIGGRNVKMNEEIVSKYLEKRDLFFHTQTPGAPVVVLKRGQEAPESSIIETAEFAAIYSSLWKEGKHSGEVYYVLPEQVSKAAKHGEYLPKGSFYITGRRNYITVEMKCAVGVELENLRVIGGPLKAVKRYADYYVELEIGDREPNELGVEISNLLADLAGDERHVVRAIATPDEVMKFLPPGKSNVVRTGRRVE